MIKSKHEPTSTRLVTLLGHLNRYTFDLKYLEGSKLKVSDALLCLYSEEKHKISDDIHGFEQKLNNNYFEAIVDHKAIDYLIKAKHEPTSIRLVTLLDHLNRYTFDLKYLEGSKLKVSDALSRLYSEEKHKISDVIPLNFLLHFTDYQLHKESDHLANKLYAHKQTKLGPKTRCNYDRQAKHKPVDRYEPPKITKKANKAAAVAKVNEGQYVAALQDIPIKALTSNENPLKKLDRIDKPLTIKQDQQEKQVINTIREVPPEM